MGDSLFKLRRYNRVFLAIWTQIPFWAPMLKQWAVGNYFLRKYSRRAHRDPQKFFFIFIKSSKWENWWSWWFRMTNAFILCNLLRKVQKSLAANRESSFKEMLRVTNMWPPYCLFTLVDPLCNHVSSLYTGLFTLAQLCSCVEPSWAYATWPTSTHQRVTWPGLYRKLIGFLCIVVWHMKVSTHLLEVRWLECVAYCKHISQLAMANSHLTITCFLCNICSSFDS